MATPFETFVNTELPLRPYASVPGGGNFTAGLFMKTTGTGMQLAPADPGFFSSSPASNTYSGVSSQVTVGENVAIGDMLYYNAADGKYWKALGTNAAVTYPSVALATASISANNSGVVFQLGYVNKSSWSWGTGSVFLSPTTYGGLTQTQPSTTGQIVQPVGYAISPTIIWFNPNQVWIELV